MPLASSPTRVFLDLGDAFTKALAIGPLERAPWRYPSVVAHRLIHDSAELQQLSLGAAGVPRPFDFDPARYPRTRSYRGAEAFLRLTHVRPPVSRTRFAGGIAAVYGADRQTLGAHPDAEVVDALVHKALLLLVHGSSSDVFDVEIVLAIDVGAKADAIARWVRTTPHRWSVEVCNYRSARSRRVDFRMECEIVDAAHWAVAALPAELEPIGSRRTLIVDVGHRRTKLWIVSVEGCEMQLDLDDLGLSTCVSAVLRDGQEKGLFEDEYAVMCALETPSDMIEIAGRRFEVGAVLADARAALEQELLRAIRRSVLDHFRSRGDTCHAVAITGGGAGSVGRRLSERVKADLGVASAWVAADGGFHLVTGAGRRSHIQAGDRR